MPGYRRLLELATAIDKQTSVQAILKSLHKLLSAILHFDGIAMMLLTEDRRSLRLVALERGSAGPHVDLGAEAPYAGYRSWSCNRRTTDDLRS